jgi:hypothetical protein
MSITASQVRALRNGAQEAASDPRLKRLAALLTTLAGVAEMLLAHGRLTPTDVADIELDDLIENGARVARDLCRTTTPTRAVDTADAA